MKNKGALFSVITALAMTGFFGCASTGSPGGGLYDEDPPVLKTATPSIGATGVKTRKITMHFNENIKLDNAMEKLVVSPPQAKQPTIMSNAKTLTIELQDTLRPNTTYSIDLGDAVQDNNEGNPLESLSMLFSTGDHIDSLQISGHLLNAADLEPITGAYVGLYNDTTTLGDSVLIKRAMERAGRTDAYGHFSIMGVAPGTYRVYAITDGNTNYKYDLNTEDIAFLDSLVVPSSVGHTVFDTLWADQDSIEIDTITSHGEILYLPNNLVLRSFNEGKVTRYLDDFKRADSVHLNVRFAANMPELPVISVVDSLEDPIELIAEPNPTKDTLLYWIKDSLHVKMDTLNLQITYLYTDTLGLDVHRTDTVRLVSPKPKPAKEDSKKDEKKAKKRSKKDNNKEVSADSLPKVKYTEVKLLKNTIDIGAKPVIEVSTPIINLEPSRIRLEAQVNDSTWEEMKFSIKQDTLRIRRYIVTADPHFSPGATYRIVIDSAAVHDIYGCPVKKAELKFNEKKPEDYSHLLFTISGVEGPAFVELLNDKDAAVYKAKVVDGKAKFVNVDAGKYYARLIEDRNNNGIFDIGNLQKHLQPETVHYFNAELQLRANWDTDQVWNVGSINPVKQKPDAVKKNKPKEKTERKSRNAEYMAKMGITPKQTNTGTTTRNQASNLNTVNRNR